jgi:SAM-dependent methyltransferase
MLLADPENALRECRRVLKQGGRLALAAWTRAADNEWSATVARELVERGLAERPDPEAPGQFAWGKEGVIADRLEAAGFVEHHVEALDFVVRHADADAWWQATKAMSRFLGEALAKDPGQEEAIRAVLAERAADYVTPAGTLEIPARTWVAWAAA